MWALIPDWLKKLLIGAGAIIVAVSVAFLKGRKAGTTAATVELQKETQKVEQKFQKIDAAPADFPGAIDSLRRRAKGKP